MTDPVNGIRYYSFGDNSGYGQSAKTYISTLLAEGHRISWYPLEWDWGKHKYMTMEERDTQQWLNSQTVMTAELAEALHRPIDYSHVIMHIVPEYWPDLMENDKTNIGYTTWEADKLPKHWPELLNPLDLILVPSKFNQRVFAGELSNTQVTVLPHIIETHSRSSEDNIRTFRQKYNIPDAKHIFYSINTWTVRKDMASLLHAYLLAFTSKDSVCLIIKTSEQGTRSRLTAKMEDVNDLVSIILSNYDDPADVVVIADDTLNNIEINALHDIGDCYFSMTCGEGWGMGAADAASAGNPVLITGWGGHLDFLGIDYPGLINYQLTPVINRIGRESHSNDQNWAKASAGDAINKLQSYVKHSEQWQEQAAKHRNKLRDFSQEAVARKFHRLLTGTG